MKKIINGITYDTSAAQQLSALYFSLHGIAIEETAYLMPEGHYFIVRSINGQETVLLTASAEDIPRWKKYRSQFPEQLWLG